MSAFITEAELAADLGETEDKVAEWRRRYNWPHLKIGRQVRYTVEDVRAIASLHHIGGRSATALPDQTARSIARSA